MGRKLEMWREFALPSKRTWGVLALALGLVVIGMGCGLALALAPDMEGDSFGTGAMVFGGMQVMVSVVILIAALRERRLLARSILWFAAVIALLSGGLVMALVMAQEPEMGLAGAGFTFTVVCGPVGLLLFVPGVIFFSKGLPEAQAALAERRQARAKDLLVVREAMTLTELGAELGISASDARGMLEEMLAAHAVEARIHVASGVVMTDLSYTKRQAQMGHVLCARGQVQMAELASELGAPADWLKAWIYELVRQGRFTGYINWQEGTLYSQEAQALRDAGCCPDCSGEIELVGKGVIQCQYCGAEIFV